MAATDQADALLLLVCCGLTLLVVPGLAVCAGGLGLGGRGGASQALQFAFAGAAMVLVLGALGGYGMMAGPEFWPHVLGGPALGVGAPADGVHGLALAGWALAVCAVAAAIVGVVAASLLSLRAWLVFSALWCAVVLFPIGNAVLDLDDGWAAAVLGAIDFGGVLVVGVAPGGSAAGLIVAWGRPEPLADGGSLRLVALGGPCVWIGWLGLTTGSEGALDEYTGLIVANSLLAAISGCVMWMIVDRIALRRPTLISAFCGTLAGLVAITPGSGILTPGWSLLLGALASLACATLADAVGRTRFGVGMALMTVVIVASLIGLLFIGLFATSAGMIDSGDFDLLIAQAIAGFAVLIGSFAVSFALALPFRLLRRLTRSRPQET